MVAGSLEKGGEVALSDHPKSVSDCNHLHNIAFKSCREINKLTPTLEVALVVFFRFSTILKKIRKKGLYVKRYDEQSARPVFIDIRTHFCSLVSYLLLKRVHEVLSRGNDLGDHFLHS